MKLLGTNITASRALVTDANKNAVTSSVTSTELGYLSGVTSALQTQLNAKEPTISAGTSAQYWRGDKTWQTLNQAAVAGLTSTDIPTFAAVVLNRTGSAPTGSKALNVTATWSTGDHDILFSNISYSGGGTMYFLRHQLNSSTYFSVNYAGTVVCPMLSIVYTGSDGHREPIIERNTTTHHAHFVFKTGSGGYHWLMGMHAGDTNNDFRLYSYGTGSKVFIIRRSDGATTLGSTAGTGAYALYAGSVYTGSTLRIDSSGNLSNIGTVACGAITTTGALALNSSGITTNQTTVSIVNATATAVNFAGAATALVMGAISSGYTQVRNELHINGKSNNGSAIKIIAATDTIVVPSGDASASGSTNIPAGSIVLAVSLRVTNANGNTGNIIAAFTSDLHDYMHNATIAISNGSTDPGTDSCPHYLASTSTITIDTSVAMTNDMTVKATYYYNESTPQTS